MNDDSGAHESRTLVGGEILYLRKEPGKMWQINSYEYGQGQRTTAAGRFFEHRQGIDPDWKDREFESVNEAVAFAERQIEEGKVPRNPK